MSVECVSPAPRALRKEEAAARDVASVVTRGSRLTWLDFFRGMAVLVMIETHVVNTFLESALREHSWFALLNYVNGLVAPSFLFIAGYVQGMERRKSPGKPINYARRAWRLAGICALGYMMHFPVGQLLLALWSEAYRVGSQVDVLQCLSVGLGMLLGVTWLVQKLAGKRANLIWSMSVVAMAGVIILGAPSAQGWTGGPLALLAWVNASTGSLFPIFPWLGFVFLGALMGARPALSAAERLGSMAGLAVLSWACRDAVFSAVSPSFFLERAAWVLGLAALCEWSSGRTFPGYVVYAGQHSLKFYVAHLAVITALVGLGVPSVSLEWPAVLALLAGVLVATTVTAWACARLPDFLRSLRSRFETPMAAPASSPSVAS